MLRIELNEKTVFVFDLDDTLYKEIDFLYSGFSQIALRLNSDNWHSLFEKMVQEYRKGADVFEFLSCSFSDCCLKKREMIELYRTHLPDIKMDLEAQVFLEKLRDGKAKTALITDGRSITQRNKLKALGLKDYFGKVIISEEVGSEKPSKANYRLVEQCYGSGSYIYFGDNYTKDFVTPNSLGWKTIAIEADERNIHRFNAGDFAIEFAPQHVIKSFSEIQLVLIA